MDLAHKGFRIRNCDGEGEGTHGMHGVTNVERGLLANASMT